MRAILMARPEPGGIDIRDDKPTPEPGEGEVRIKVARAAICGTDRHIFHWDPSIHHLMNLPVVIGHEFCGHIDALGPGVGAGTVGMGSGASTMNGHQGLHGGQAWAEGDYVSAEMHFVCHECRACKAGNEHMCTNTRIGGLAIDGALAEYVVVPARNLVRLDESVVPVRVGGFLDALGNAVHTVQRCTGVTGKHVLITGYGAIGSMAASIVELEGAASLSISDVSPGALKRARDWAASVSGRVPVSVYDPSKMGVEEVQGAIRAATDGGVDVVLEMSGAPQAINKGLESLYPGGEMIMLGLPSARDVTLEEFTPRIIFKGLTLKGVVGRRMFGTWEAMLDLLHRGLNVDHVVSHELTLDEFPEAIRLLDAGEAQKVVLNPHA